MRSFLFLLLPGMLPTLCLASLQLAGEYTQGGLLRGQVAPDTQVYYGEQRLKVSKEGHFLLGFGRDAAPGHALTLVDRSGQVSIEKISIAQRSYRIQRIEGISKKLMSPDQRDLQRIGREAAEAAAARKTDSDLQHFRDNFIWPLTGPVTGVYGSQRVFNGQPRRPHFGVDIAAPTGTAVLAPASGRVTLAHPGMFFSGTTLIIDHGHGLSSSFLHLDKILVSAGQLVRQGQKIATVGATGRVTGPHLDWRINWFEQRLDPALLVPQMP